MREIKFRQWNNGKMRFFNLGQQVQGFPDHEENNAVMRFTGLLDRLGKEIYEGDVLCIENYYHDYQDGIAINSLPDNKIEAVEWDSKHGMWITESDSLAEQLDLIEVIGNIYENPELIN